MPGTNHLVVKVNAKTLDIYSDHFTQNLRFTFILFKKPNCIINKAEKIFSVATNTEIDQYTTPKMSFLVETCQLLQLDCFQRCENIR